MISNTMKLNATYKSTVAVEQLESSLKKEIKMQQPIAQRTTSLQGNPLELGNAYILILENGGYLGC